jgi:hypothetical protein
MHLFWIVLGSLHTPAGPVSPVVDLYDPRVHIGERVDGGRYCRPCGQTLCARGEQQVLSARADEWRWGCPRCGDERPESVPAMRYAQDPATVLAACRAHPDALVARDEAGREYTGSQLEAALGECPIALVADVGQRWHS